jgi:hypothetical protein
VKALTCQARPESSERDLGQQALPEETSTPAGNGFRNKSRRTQKTNHPATYNITGKQAKTRASKKQPRTGKATTHGSERSCKRNTRQHDPRSTSTLSQGETETQVGLAAPKGPTDPSQNRKRTCQFSTITRGAMPPQGIHRIPRKTLCLIQWA